MDAVLAHGAHMSSGQGVIEAMGLKAGFWRGRTLEDFSTEEWEALCDGCARCCTLRLEDEETGAVFETCVSCKLLDLKSLRCSRYERRFEHVSDCLNVTPDMVRRTRWLPETCAYRRVAEGKPLPDWHYLVCGDREEVHRRGISLKGQMLPETAVDDADLEDWIIEES
jgi:hypothetical protein